MAIHFWYILIHITLGLVGYQVFTFTNIGGIYAALVTAVVQGYAIWEIHKIARPKFEAAAVGASQMQRREMEKGYRIRLARVWLLRTCLYALLTLVAALAVRGGARL